jgi:hypothetical protein
MRRTLSPGATSATIAWPHHFSGWLALEEPELKATDLVHAVAPVGNPLMHERFAELGDPARNVVIDRIRSAVLKGVTQALAAPKPQSSIAAVLGGMDEADLKAWALPDALGDDTGGGGGRGGEPDRRRSAWHLAAAGEVGDYEGLHGRDCWNERPPGGPTKVTMLVGPYRTAVRRSASAVLAVPCSCTGTGLFAVLATVTELASPVACAMSERNTVAPRTTPTRTAPSAERLGRPGRSAFV